MEPQNQEEQIRSLVLAEPAAGPPGVLDLGIYHLSVSPEYLGGVLRAWDHHRLIPAQAEQALEPAATGT